MKNKKKIINQTIPETLKTNYMPYAMSVIVSRAIPEIDGFKPSHRKLLYTMYKMNLLKSQRTKSANVVGQTMKLNPHGDAAIYETMVRLTKAHGALLTPFVDSKGNFGKISSRDMAYAAPRYTEVKLSEICEELFQDINENTVDFVDNYDATTKEPLLLPVKYPSILVNANRGIAVGMASAFPGFNLGEVISYMLSLIEDENTKAEKHILGPDFMTGALMIRDKKTLMDMLYKGTGTVKLRAKYRYDEKERLIEIYEIPYTTTVEAIVDKVVSVYKLGKLKELSDIRDETDLGGLKIAIDVKRGTDIDLFIAKLYKMTPMEDSFSCNFNLLVENKPMQLSFVDIAKKWLEHRISQIKRRTEFQAEKLRKRLHLLKALEKILLDIDRAIEIIRKTEKDSQVIENLMKGFGIDKIQAEYIAEIKLRNLNKEYLLNSISAISDLEKDIKNKEDIIASETLQKNIIADELKKINKKYNAKRRTELIENIEEISLTEEEMIEDFNLKLFLSKHGYIKKISLQSLRASGEQKYKDDDEFLQEIETSNAADIMFFTDKHNVYFIKAHELPDSKASELGEYLPNLIQMEDGETVVFMHATKEYSGYFLFAFKDAKIAKVPLSSYKTKQNRSKLLNAYGSKSELITILYIEEDLDIIICRTDARSKNLALLDTSLISPKVSRSTIGVGVIRLKKASYLSSVNLAKNIELKDKESYRVQNNQTAGKEISPEDHFANPFL